MLGEDEVAFKKLLYCIEHTGEICRVGNGRSGIADAIERLRECGSAEAHFVAAHVYVDERGLLQLGNRRGHAADIAHFTCGRDDYGSRCHHFLVSVFLGHGERILAGRDVDAESACKV